MEDFEEDDTTSTLVFRFGMSGEVIDLPRRPKTVGEAEMMALAAVRKKIPTAQRVSLVHGDTILRNSYPILGDAEIDVVVVKKSDRDCLI